MPTLIERLGDFVSNLSFQSLPGEVKDTIKTSILHHIHTGFSGFGERESKIARSFSMDRSSDGGCCTVLGEKQKTSVIRAVFANAVMMHSVQQEDTYKGLHPGPHTIPSALALAQYNSLAGRDIITAISAGYEVNLQVGKEFAKFTSPRGWRGTTIYGVLGSAATSAYLLNLDTDQVIGALANAINYASGLMQCWLEGTPEWLFTSGLTAKNGVIAALLAQKGTAGARESFEGNRGYIKAYCGVDSEKSEIDAVIRGIKNSIGKDYVTPDILFKPHSVITTILPVIHNVITLVKRDDITPDAVEELRIVAGSRVTDGALTDSILDSGPYTTKTQAFKSLPCAAGIAVSFREVSADTASHYSDSTVRNIASKVSIERDASAEGFYNTVEIQTNDGKTHSIAGDVFPTVTRKQAKMNLKGSASKYLSPETVENLVCVIESFEKFTADDFRLAPK